METGGGAGTVDDYRYGDRRWSRDSRWIIG